MSHNQRVALFPLSQPLYPGVAIKLRIFEQRYLRLVRETAAGQKPFAVVPIIRGYEVGGPPAFYPFGTLVRIVDWEQQPGGLLGITILGDRRIRVRESEVEKDGLIVGDIDTLSPESGEMPDTEYQDLEQLLNDLVSGLKMDYLFPRDQPVTIAALGWQLATLLPVASEVKMALLAEDNPHERLDLIRQGIAEMIANGESDSDD